MLDVTDPGLTLGDVENEDYVISILRMASGTLSVCEANRAAVGEQNNYAFEVHGMVHPEGAVELSTAEEQGAVVTEGVHSG